MKKSLLLIALLFAATGAAMADSTSATSAGTTVTVNVVAPISVSCASTFTINNALASSSGARETTPKSFNCTPSTTGITPDSSGVVWSAISTTLTANGQTAIPASAISLSSTSGGTYAALNSDNSTYVSFLTESSTTSDAVQPVFVKVNVPQSQAAASYTGTLTVQLSVTFTP